MERKSIEKYAKTAERDVKFVDEAIQKGAYPSFEEWHDFVFKADVSAFKSDELAKYEVMRPRAVEIARIESLILTNIINIQIRGFTDASAQKSVKTIMKRFNKQLKFLESMKFSRTDRDGTIFFSVESYDYSTRIEKGIVDRNSLCMFLIELWGMGLREMRVFNKDTLRFLEEHLNNEIHLLETGTRPSPYFGCARANTVECVMFTRTDYETARKAPLNPPKQQAKPAQLKVAK